MSEQQKAVQLTEYEASIVKELNLDSYSYPLLHLVSLQDYEPDLVSKIGALDGESESRVWDALRYVYTVKTTKKVLLAETFSDEGDSYHVVFWDVNNGWYLSHGKYTINELTQRVNIFNGKTYKFDQQAIDTAPQWVRACKQADAE